MVTGIRITGVNNVKSAQVYKGMINGTEDFYESPDIYQVISQESLDVLLDRTRIGEYPVRVFLKEGVVAKTVISKPQSDILGRDGIINHTVIYAFDISVKKDGVKYTLDQDQFEQDARSGKFNFKMPSPPKLTRPLPYPPSMEV